MIRPQSAWHAVWRRANSAVIRAAPIASTVNCRVHVSAITGIFTKMVDAALEHPDDTIRDAVYPAVPGGVKTLSALARELKATERAVAERVRYQLRGSYSHYYRRMLAPLLAALEFRCNNSAYRPVMGVRTAGRRAGSSTPAAGPPPAASSGGGSRSCRSWRAACGRGRPAQPIVPPV
jgi:hypothetical protein